MVVAPKRSPRRPLEGPRLASDRLGSLEVAYQQQLIHVSRQAEPVSASLSIPSLRRGGSGGGRRLTFGNIS